MKLIQDFEQEYANLVGQLGQAVYHAEHELPALIVELKAKIASLKQQHKEAVAASAVQEVK